MDQNFPDSNEIIEMNPDIPNAEDVAPEATEQVTENPEPTETEPSAEVDTDIPDMEDVPSEPAEQVTENPTRAAAVQSAVVNGFRAFAKWCGSVIKEKWFPKFVMAGLIIIGAIIGMKQTVFKTMPGFSVVDFAEPIIIEMNNSPKLSVRERKVIETVTISDYILLNIPIFRTSQKIKYVGTVPYYVNLEELSLRDFEVDEASKTVTVYIPHAQRGEINIPRETIEYFDTEQGWLAFSEVSATPEEVNKLESKAIQLINERLDAEGEDSTADDFAVLFIEKLFQPFVQKVSPEYDIQVKVR